MKLDCRYISFIVFLTSFTYALKCLHTIPHSYSQRTFSTLFASTSSAPTPLSKIKSITSLFSNIQKNSDNSLMSFGNRIEMNIRLPTRDPELATSFIRNPRSIIEKTWDKTKLQRKSDTCYLLKFREFPLPGMDAISPEIEVDLRFDDGKIKMQSGDWTIRSKTGGIMKDSKFLNTFDIKLYGEMSIVGGNSSSQALFARGSVEYRVQGTKPSVFRAAPSFVLDATIRLIQESVKDYASKEFANRFSKEFRDYMMSTIVANQLHSVV